MILDKKQKISLLFLAAFIFLMIAPSLLPSAWLLTKLISHLGIVGNVFLLLIVMFWTTSDQQPILDFSKMAHYINWDMYIMMAFIMPFASILTNDNTGVKQTVINLLTPLLGGQTPFLFLGLSLLLATLLTNIANNMVVGAVFATLIYTMGSGMGIETLPAIVVLIVCVNFSIATPAASPGAALMFTNQAWLRPSDIYKLSLLIVLLMFILTAVAGMLLATFIYAL